MAQEISVWGDSYRSVLRDAIPRQLRAVIGRDCFFLYVGGVSYIFHEPKSISIDLSNSTSLNSSSGYHFSGTTGLYDDMQKSTL
jgi:hypothetical protein